MSIFLGLDKIRGISGDTCLLCFAGKTGLKMGSDTEGRAQCHAPLHAAPLPFEGIMGLKYQYMHSEGDINSLIRR